ncbi:DUF2117 domain-containing protein [Methanosarcina horonobensis]|nr:DUF2117 domain-containing protein [Methanosarcina horonobensis]
MKAELGGTMGKAAVIDAGLEKNHRYKQASKAKRLY